MRPKRGDDHISHSWDDQAAHVSPGANAGPAGAWGGAAERRPQQRAGAEWSARGELAPLCQCAVTPDGRLGQMERAW